MNSTKEIKHLLINLYCKKFGGSPVDFEIMDGPDDRYVFRRKEDGLIALIPKNSLSLYISNNKSLREKGRLSIIEAFQNFKQPIDTDRLHDRYDYESPDFAYVKFKIEKETEKDVFRLLNIINSSKSGLALLITQKDSDLLDILKEGDKIRDMSFFGIGAKIKRDGIVKHMSKIEDGKFKGCFVLGIEAPDL